MFRLEDICLEKALLSPESETLVGKAITQTQQGVYASPWHKHCQTCLLRFFYSLYYFLLNFQESCGFHMVTFISDAFIAIVSFKKYAL